FDCGDAVDRSINQWIGASMGFENTYVAVRLWLALVWWQLCRWIFDLVSVKTLRPTTDMFHKVVVIGDDFGAGIGDYLTFGSAGGIAEYLKTFIKRSEKVCEQQRPATQRTMAAWQRQQHPVRQSWAVVNAAVPGTVAADWSPLAGNKGVSAAQYFDRVFTSRSLRDAEVIVVMLGSLDQRKGIPVAETKRHLMSICDTLRKKGKRVCLATAASAAPLSKNAASETELNKAIQEMASAASAMAMARSAPSRATQFAAMRSWATGGRHLTSATRWIGASMGFENTYVAVRLWLALVWWQLCRWIFDLVSVKTLRPTTDMFHKVVVIGDDFGAGIGDYLTFGSAGGIAEYLKTFIKRSEKVRQSWAVVNAAVPGTVAADWSPLAGNKGVSAAQYFDRVFTSRSLRDAEVIVVMLGSLDQRKGIPVAETKRHLMSICDTLRKKGKRVCLATAASAAPLSKNAASETELNKAIQDYCKSTAVEDMPVVLAPRLDLPLFHRESSLSFDQFHFNSTAYRALAKGAADSLIPMLTAVEWATWKTKFDNVKYDPALYH
ncbi:TPA: hypothetical protein N0F65_011899, partial [Lagenidium giganteum]